MKKTSFLLFAVWCLLSCGVHHNLNNPYNNAYKYIVKDMMTKDKYVAVMDSLVEFDRYMAMYHIKGHFDTSLLEDSTEKRPDVDYLIHQLPIKASDPRQILLFSRMEDNMITAEAVDYQHFEKYGNDRQTTIRSYLLMFDDKMRIKNVISQNVMTE